MLFFQHLETLYTDLLKWEVSSLESCTKQEVIKNVRSHVVAMLTQLLATPHIGTAFAHPSDTLQIHTGAGSDESELWFYSDACVVNDT